MPMTQEEWDKFNDDLGFPRNPLPPPRARASGAMRQRESIGRPWWKRPANSWKSIFGVQLTPGEWANDHVVARLHSATDDFHKRRTYLPPEGSERPWSFDTVPQWVVPLEEMSDDELEAYRRAVAAVRPKEYWHEQRLRHWGKPKVRAWAEAHLRAELELEMSRRGHPLS